MEMRGLKQQWEKTEQETKLLSTFKALPAKMKRLINLNKILTSDPVKIIEALVKEV